MKIAVTLHDWDYRGDHSADVAIAHELKPGETVEQLAKRLLGETGRTALEARESSLRYIEIRLVVEAES